MDHAHIQIVCTQAAQLVGKALPHLRHVPGALILPVLPDGAEMSLEDKAVPPSRQGPAQAVPDVGIRGVEVDAADAGGIHHIHHLHHLLRRLAHESLAAHADLAHLDPGAAQCTLLHSNLLLYVGLIGFPCHPA